MQPQETQRFLEVLVHDVRAAQRAINTSAQLLSGLPSSEVSEETRQILQMLQAGVARMNLLMSGVGHFTSSLPHGQYSFRPISLEIPLKLALANLAAEIKDSSADVSYGDMPQVQGDSDRLTCLFQNLIGNAIKYRGDSEPRVAIEVNTGTVAVKDNGIGIAEKYWGQLFQPFQRLHGPDIPGAGLGLAICRQVVEAHGGKIWIASKPGEGSTFFFTLSANGDGRPRAESIT